MRHNIYPKLDYHWDDIPALFSPLIPNVSFFLKNTSKQTEPDAYSPFHIFLLKRQKSIVYAFFSAPINVFSGKQFNYLS